MMRCRLVLLFLPFALVGCGSKGPRLAEVSGTVYWDGKPLPNVHVNFQPKGSKENPNPGRGSHAVTDSDGRYTLSYDGGKGKGAVVGPHRVAISSVLPDEQGFDPEVGSPDGTVPKGQNMIPPRYNDKTTLEFTVPESGVDNADFSLESDEALKKKQRERQKKN